MQRQGQIKQTIFHKIALDVLFARENKLLQEPLLIRVCYVINIVLFNYFTVSQHFHTQDYFNIIMSEN